MRITLCSLSIEWQDVEKNKKLITEAVIESKKYGSSLVVFPEMCLTGYGKESIEKVEETNALLFFSEISKKHSIHIIFGWVKTVNSLHYNSATLLDDNGIELCTYDKIHLFTFANENTYITQGNTPFFCPLLETTIGLTICYDLRFGELFRYLADFSEIIFNIASWPKSRTSHFITLLKARAIENQLFMVGLNRSGYDNDNVLFGGDAVVFAPDGREVERKEIAENLFLFDIDVSEVVKERDHFRFLQDKQKELYREWIE